MEIKLSDNQAALIFLVDDALSHDTCEWDNISLSVAGHGNQARKLCEAIYENYSSSGRFRYELMSLLETPLEEATDIDLAHKHSFKNRKEILASETCGCFDCLHEFPPTSIGWWTDYNNDEIGQTALCPQCGGDCVLGDSSGYPVDEDFLRGMNKRWFGGHVG